ncbi:hypothetical protein B7494_g3796 [Chlorociboria aeruginascens]|nr:hypothetical protein B7494_g3796 [Chlorociboria aeruginascens]
MPISDQVNYTDPNNFPIESVDLVIEPVRSSTTSPAPTRHSFGEWLGSLRGKRTNQNRPTINDEISRLVREACLFKRQRDEQLRTMLQDPDRHETNYNKVKFEWGIDLENKLRAIERLLSERGRPMPTEKENTLFKYYFRKRFLALFLPREKFLDVLLLNHISEANTFQYILPRKNTDILFYLEYDMVMPRELYSEEYKEKDYWEVYAWAIELGADKDAVKLITRMEKGRRDVEIKVSQEEDLAPNFSHSPSLVSNWFKLSSIVWAVPPFDPAGAKNVGNGAGGQFIGGQCLSDTDCGSGCCANPTGICSGLGASTQNGKTGCGFVSGTSSPVSSSPVVAAAASIPTATIATSNVNGGPAFDPAGVKNVGNGAGEQFIGGQCLSGADCASTCCAGPSGICSGIGAQTQAGKTGCGFVSGNVSEPASSSVAVAAASVSTATSNASGGPAFDPAGVKNVGNGAGGQFIGGQCLSAADCGSGCCAGPSGICSGVGAQTQAGKTGCGFVSTKKLVRM